jgi:hypothetical protein
MTCLESGSEPTVGDLDQQNDQESDCQFGRQGPACFFVLVWEAKFMSEGSPQAETEQRQGEQKVDR